MQQSVVGGNADTEKLRRTLGLPLLLFYGVGVIVGAGIYSVLGAAAGVAGHGLWLSMLVAGIPAVLTALCYAELSTRYPRAGGGFVYVREALPRWPSVSLVVGLLTVATAAATAATVATAFGGYLAEFVGDWWPAWMGALGLIVACTLINMAGIRESTWVTVTCTVVEVVGLVLIIGAGVGVGQFGEAAMDFEFPKVLIGAALAFFVFTGFEGLVNLAEEAKRPRRDLPRALMLSVGITLVLYVLTALGALALAGPEELADSDSPLSTAAGKASPRLATAMVWIALISTMNTGLITLVVASRLMYGMAQEGSLPRIIGATLPGRKSPWVAALILGSGGAAMLPLGGVAVLGSVSSLITLMVFMAVCGALILIRQREKRGEKVQGEAGTERPFRVWGSVWGVPVVAAAAIIAILALATRFDGKVYAVAGGVLVAAIIAGVVRGIVVHRDARKGTP